MGTGYATIGRPTPTYLSHIIHGLLSAQVAETHYGLAVSLRFGQRQDVWLYSRPTRGLMAVLLRQCHGIANMTGTAVVGCKDKEQTFLTVGNIGEGAVQLTEIAHTGLDIG